MIKIADILLNSNIQSLDINYFEILCFNLNDFLKLNSYVTFIILSSRRDSSFDNIIYFVLPLSQNTRFNFLYLKLSNLKS